MRSNTFAITAPIVLRLRATESIDHEAHVVWRLGFAEAPEVEDGVESRLVFGNLHASGIHGWADVDVRARFVNTSALPAETPVADLLKGAAAAETLYDFARSHVLGILATVGAHVEVPVKAPEPEIKPLRPPSEEEVAEALEDATDVAAEEE